MDLLFSSSSSFSLRLWFAEHTVRHFFFIAAAAFLCDVFALFDHISKWKRKYDT